MGAESSRTLQLRARLRYAAGPRPFELEVAADFPPGITILFGSSGAGKTTLLRLISGIEERFSGRVQLGDELWFDSASGVRLPVHRRGVAYVLQTLALFPHLTALANVAYGLPRSWPRAQRRQHALAWLEKLRAGALADRKPETFSGGEAQRVAIARALAMGPRIVLLDEPFSALDVPLRIEFGKLVRSLVEELGIPMIHVTHNPEVASALGDRILRLEHGRVASVQTIETAPTADRDSR